MERAAGAVSQKKEAKKFLNFVFFLILCGAIIGVTSLILRIFNTEFDRYLIRNFEAALVISIIMAITGIGNVITFFAEKKRRFLYLVIAVGWFYWATVFIGSALNYQSYKQLKWSVEIMPQSSQDEALPQEENYPLEAGDISI